MDESGATAIEYGLIAGMVAIVAISAMIAFGKSASTMFETISEAVTKAMAA